MYVDLIPGNRIELVAMFDDPNPIPVGSKGTVKDIRDHSSTMGFTQIDVAWDNGRTLMLSVPPDQYRKI